ncbi:cystathionine beta-lyase [Dyella flagellata]|uniref:Cystathionine beta-lyase n=1 Tax=Dyella flagellata TaxID=1867833 RepID=A0ABQ5XDR3_9GAMM|nr:cystathionine beta-lyase [Dyella flagellata]GLQ89831.1 cystathionine beta-lyase [Dyella flagellata]
MHWRSKLLHPSSHAPGGFRSLVTPIYRGSTVLFEKTADIADEWRQEAHGYTYGLYGSPTVLELGARIAELDGAHYCFVVPGGQAAIAVVYLAFCTAGSHGLVPYSAYGPSKELAHGLLKGLGIEIETYDPAIGSGIAALIRPNTALIWTESPGSVTMEVQDVPAIVAAAKARGVPVALDNTYAAGVLFDAFHHGVDVSVQALTKYVGGHSDLLLGAVSVANAALYEKLGSIWSQLGMAVSPDDASLALRGLQTMGIRLERLESSTLKVAKWLQDRAEVETVLHPALPDSPGHEIWKRDFKGSASVFSFVLESKVSREKVSAFVDSLTLFRKGFSWGGTASLAMVYPDLRRPNRGYEGRLVRLNIGLEEPDDLIDDLRQAFDRLRAGDQAEQKLFSAAPVGSF